MGSVTLPDYHPYQARVATELQSATGAAEALLAEREARVTGREARLTQMMEDQERQVRAAAATEGRKAAHALHMHCIHTACTLHITAYTHTRMACAHAHVHVHCVCTACACALHVRCICTAGACACAQHTHRRRAPQSWR